MFETVTSKRQQKRFERIWEAECLKNGWYNDPYGDDAVRYNLLTSNRIPFVKNTIGTIEFVPYDPSNPASTVEGPDRPTFTTYQDIIEHQSSTWEIDKLCIKESFQRKGHFQGFMEIFHHHAVTYQPTYYIALMEKKFYRMLRISFGLAVEQRGEELVGEGTSLVPIVFHVAAVMQDPKLVQRYVKVNSA